MHCGTPSDSPSIMDCKKRNTFWKGAPNLGIDLARIQYTAGEYPSVFPTGEAILISIGPLMRSWYVGGKITSLEEYILTSPVSLLICRPSCLRASPCLLSAARHQFGIQIFLEKGCPKGKA